MKILLSLLLLFSGFVFASADKALPSMAPVAAHTAYIPAGFDNNDRVQIMLEGNFRDNCYRVGSYKKVIAPGKITIFLSAYKYQTGCNDVEVPFSQEVQLGLLPEGRYAVVDGNSGRVLGQLPIKVARVSSPDDHVYAPVSDVNIAYGPAYNAIAVSGEFNASCYTLKSVNAIIDGNKVITVLPIAERNPGTCVHGRFPYRKYAPFPQGVNGRNLVQVRSLSGQALNKLVDL